MSTFEVCLLVGFTPSTQRRHIALLSAVEAEDERIKDGCLAAPPRVISCTSMDGALLDVTVRGTKAAERRISGPVTARLTLKCGGNDKRANRRACDHVVVAVISKFSEIEHVIVGLGGQLPP